MAYLGVNVADTRDRAREFVEEFGWSWPSIRDPERQQARLLGADYQPYVALIDADGRLVASFDGGGTEEDWRALLERLP